MPETKLDPKEQKYEQLRRLGQELHIPIPEAFWKLEVFDKDGKLIQKHKQRSHSWTRNAYNHLFSQLAQKNGNDDTFGAGKLSIKDYNGVIKYGTNPIGQDYSKNVDNPAINYGYLCSAAWVVSGIQVGSGTNAESFEDYVLQTPIAEGTGAGEINHIASELHSISYSDTTLTDELVRYFNNNSGGNISVNEVALTMNGYLAANIKWVQSRDKLGATVTVPDTGQLKVTYTIELAYPA